MRCVGSGSLVFLAASHSLAAFQTATPSHLLPRRAFAFCSVWTPSVCSCVAPLTQRHAFSLTRFHLASKLRRPRLPRLRAERALPRPSSRFIPPLSFLTHFYSSSPRELVFFFSKFMGLSKFSRISVGNFDYFSSLLRKESTF